MTLSGKLIYLAVVLVVFALAMTFRMAIEGAMLKVFMALSGAWLISKVHYRLRIT